MEGPSHNQQYSIMNHIPDMTYYFKQKLYKKLSSGYYNKFSLFPGNDPDRVKFSDYFQTMKQNNNFSPQILNLSSKQSRGIASVLGMGISDALGASTEFMSFNKQGLGLIKQGFSDIQKAIESKLIHPRSGRIGIWTDDASMGLAMGYSVLLNNYKFDAKHMRYMFMLWLENGLGNGGRQYSIGLGGNISISMEQFARNQTQYAEEGNRFNNGNGSLMRLAPVPVAFSDNLEKAIEYSGNQSRTTHNGLEAQQCSKLMASILVNLINRGQKEDWRQVLQKTCNQFKSVSKQVQFLAQSKQQTQEMFIQKAQKYQKSFLQYNKGPQDRNWNWKNKQHTYSPRRLHQQPGYIGSYCMDALAMALHTVWHTKSFKECAIMNADLGGDCDTVGSIAGQIAGAVYGVSEDMLRLYSEMQDFSTKRYEVFLMGYKLANKIRVVQNNQQRNHHQKMQVE